MNFFIIQFYLSIHNDIHAPFINIPGAITFSIESQPLLLLLLYAMHIVPGAIIVITADNGFWQNIFTKRHCSFKALNNVHAQAKQKADKHTHENTRKSCCIYTHFEIFHLFQHPLAVLDETSSRKRVCVCMSFAFRISQDSSPPRMCAPHHHVYN